MASKNSRLYSAALVLRVLACMLAGSGASTVTELTDSTQTANPSSTITPGPGIQALSTALAFRGENTAPPPGGLLRALIEREVDKDPITLVGFGCIAVYGRGSLTSSGPGFRAGISSGRDSRLDWGVGRGKRYRPEMTLELRNAGRANQTGRSVIQTAITPRNQARSQPRTQICMGTGLRHWATLRTRPRN